MATYIAVLQFEKTVLLARYYFNFGSFAQIFFFFMDDPFKMNLVIKIKNYFFFLSQLGI